MFWLWLVLIQIFIFTMLILFLRVTLNRNITSATAHLHELNEDYNEKVESANKKKTEVDNYYNEMLLKAKADAEKQKVAILREAQETQEAVLKDARRQGEDIIANAHKAKDQALEEMGLRVEERALSKSAELVHELLTAEMSEALHQLWVKELLKTGLEDMGKLNLPEGVKEIVVQSAFPLTSEQKTVMQKKFTQALGKNVPLAEELAPDLIAGIRIRLGSVLVDGSLQFKIKEIARDANHV